MTVFTAACAEGFKIQGYQSFSCVSLYVLVCAAIDHQGAHMKMAY